MRKLFIETRFGKKLSKAFLIPITLFVCQIGVVAQQVPIKSGHSKKYASANSTAISFQTTTALCSVADFFECPVAISEPGLGYFSADAGSDFSVCNGSTNDKILLNAVAATAGSVGTWSVTGFPSGTVAGTFSNINDANAIYSGATVAGNYTFSWTVDDGVTSTTDFITVTVDPLSCVTIKGTVFNDFNGNTLINGADVGTTAGTNLYLYLVSLSNVIVDSAKVSTTGLYTLNASQNTDYTLHLSTIQYEIGTNIITTPIINTAPTGWVTTGENGAGNTGSGDGYRNGILGIKTLLANATQQNFGITNMQPFICSALAYQVSGDINTNSTLYQYNVNTGTRSVISPLSFRANAIGFSIIDNMIWGYDRSNNRVARLDATGKSLFYDIPNLPNGDFNVGSVFGNGYLFLYYSRTARYYVVDINPARSTFLQLMEHHPTDGFIADSSPYGIALSNSAGVDVSDVAYNPVSGLLYGVVDPGGTHEYKIATINPLTGAITYSTAIVSGAGIQTEESGYGSAFADANSTKLYVFANKQGRFYEIDLATNTASRLSTPGDANNNDGTNCPGTSFTIPITGNVFDDINGLTDLTVNGSPTNVGNTLIAILYNKTTNQVVDTTYVLADGTYLLNGLPENSYSVYLSVTPAVIGQSAIPVVAPPAEWINTGDNWGEANGDDGSVNGMLDLGIISAAVSHVNFAIQQPPVAGSSIMPNQQNNQGSYSFPVPPFQFSGTDPSVGGTVSKIRFTSFPLNINTITIDGIKYGAGFATWPTGGVTVTAGSNGQPSVPVAADPVDGIVNIVIPYVTIDNANSVSPIATVTIPFTVILPVTGLELSIVNNNNCSQIISRPSKSA